MPGLPRRAVVDHQEPIRRADGPRRPLARLVVRQMEAERVPLPVGHLKRAFRHSDTSSTVTTTSSFTLVIGRPIHGLACEGTRRSGYSSRSASRGATLIADVLPWLRDCDSTPPRRLLQSRGIEHN